MKKLLTRPITAWKAVLFAVVMGPLGTALIRASRWYFLCVNKGVMYGGTFLNDPASCLGDAAKVFRFHLIGGWW